MKKFGILIFIVALLAGVVFANMFSFGRVSGKIFNFSISRSVKGSGVAASDIRNVSEFSSVEVGGIFQVEVTIGKDYSVEVSADDNLLQHIKTEVNNGVLEISASERLKSRSPLRIRVSTPELERVEASGVSQVTVSGVSNSQLSIDTSGASRLNVSGQTGVLTVEVSGASSVDASGLKAKTADVAASGASRAKVAVSDKLIANASGASNIAYNGNPASVEKSSSGASKIHQR